MELEPSVLTRRDRLQRIAGAERDRRDGRIELAIASLGEATEWPARVVLALARLAPDEALESRAILEATLDDWARENGLAPLARDEDEGDESEPLVEVDDDDRAPSEAGGVVIGEAVAADEATVLGTELVADTASGLGSEFEADAATVLGAPIAAGQGAALDAPIAVGQGAALDAPIEAFELEHAFAQAEAQVDEMHDVNAVAARVLSDEPTGLTELDDAGDVAAADTPPRRDIILATLERWLANLERNKLERDRAGRAR